MKSLLSCLVSFVALLSAVPARSDNKEKTPQQIENLAKELVRKLGSRDFSEREAASQELAKLGLAALKAIDEGRKNPDAEIMSRCESLYAEIRLLDLKRRIEELAADTDGRIANTLPLGATFEKICGKDTNARKFYFDLYMKNRQLLDDAADNPKGTGETYLSFSYDALYRGNPNPVRPGNRRVEGPLSVTEIASLFLIGADEQIGPIINEAKIKTDPRQPDGGKFQDRKSVV